MMTVTITPRRPADSSPHAFALPTVRERPPVSRPDGTLPTG